MEIELLVQVEGPVVCLPVFLEEVVNPLEREFGSNLIIFILAAIVSVRAVLHAADSTVARCITFSRVNHRGRVLRRDVCH